MQKCYLPLLVSLLAISPPGMGKAVVPAKTARPPAPAVAPAPVGQVIKTLYFTQELAPPAALSNLDPFIPNKGVTGAELGMQDNNTTGQFTKQQFQLMQVTVPLDGDIVQSFNQHAADVDVIILNLNAQQLLQIADLPAAQQKLLFNIGSSDDALRNADCRSNMLHILPSRAMRADALAQYLLKKRWQKWFLVTGQATEDKLYAQAIQRAAKRYGMKIVAEKSWTNVFDTRRNAQADVPEFTQGVEYDVLIVADEQGLFGEYLDYRTWLPRPVAGTQGLIATAWHRTHELWGATQLQNRFKQQAGRWMEEQDFAGYLAERAIGEAAIRSKSNQLSDIRHYLYSASFALQGYMGTPMSFRTWDGQLRQPVLLSAPRAQIAVAPIEGFLHPKTELDTLGYDQPETGCKVER